MKTILKIKSTILLLALLVSGCATNPNIETLTSQQRERLSIIRIVPGKISQPYKQISAVKGISCSRNAYQSHSLTRDEAIEGVKLSAAQANADAVINLHCQYNQEVDWNNNCWKSIICVGDAISFDN